MGLGVPWGRERDEADHRQQDPGVPGGDGDGLHDGRRAAATEAIGDALLPTGTILNDSYRIDQLIASGGMGDVYRATHLRLQGPIAIKVLHRSLLNEDGLLARFRTEALIMAGLRHPHIVQVFDFNVTDDGVPYLVMELAEGSDLRSLTGSGQQMPPAAVSQIVGQIAGALGAAHARGIVHRDLKPENVVLVPMDDGGPCAKVVDFGVSKTRGLPRITVEPALIGTPEFMAPEQAQGQSDLIDHRTDQFALGILAYYMFTGREPFRGACPVAVLYQIVHEEPPALRSFVPWSSRRTDAVLRRAMAKRPERRFPTIQDFARALEEAVSLDLGARGGREGRVASAWERRADAPSAAARACGPSLGGRPRGGVARRPQAFRPRRRPWRVAMFVAAAVCAATVLLSASAQRGLAEPPGVVATARHRPPERAAALTAPEQARMAARLENLPDASLWMATSGP